ncbi:ATP-binding cassette domain-containing protein [Schleiferilactobacillus shenzhenensis]|uniref:ABC transporter domain-containing protein n=1 Tax=Schleiferilactobacillus shenzhenensis LY-73 TaxID=1231336 RepID=U4TPB7_9LACO|nr:ATP-binding cassette domain-containing protein [Schleiferilactobacillus shenzhenensis]ERL65290.1 hypothetical protein L248_2689 [Schleiferilactobacillus shenzhenensis LY-73]
MEIKVLAAAKKIHGKTIFKNVTLTLHSGTIYGLTGPNGAGKTMLLRAMTGLIRLSAGSISMGGHFVHLNKKLPVSTGAIIETPEFLDNISGIANLKTLASINGWADLSLISELAQMLGLQSSDLTEKVSHYSLGMRQKLGIIQAVMENQQIILLDEPTNGLDKDAISAFQHLMLQLRADDRLIVIASHDDRTVAALSTDIIEMHDGEVQPASERRNAS